MRDDRSDVLEKDNVTKLVKERLTKIVGDMLAERGFHRVTSADDSLTDSGLSSFDMVNLMLRVEQEYDLRFPDAAMTPANFHSVTSVCQLVTDMLPKT